MYEHGYSFGPSKLASLFLTNTIDEERTVTVTIEVTDGHEEPSFEETFDTESIGFAVATEE